ncbi:MAG: DUF4358 domain-containing protein [Clostridia bacterium]|nr:DUF4358 domain-containing protein [Clostridia bacterium]
MKNTPRTLALLLAILVLALVCTACSAPTLRNDVSIAELSAVVEPKIANAEHLDTADADYFRFNLEGTEIAEERIVRLAISGKTLDEYGIFRAASDEDVAQLKDACEAYLVRRNEAWMNEYLVEEYPKLRDAEVHVIGRYVVVLILSDTETEAVLAAITESLK